MSPSEWLRCLSVGGDSVVVTANQCAVSRGQRPLHHRHLLILITSEWEAASRHVLMIFNAGNNGGSLFSVPRI